MSTTHARHLIAFGALAAGLAGCHSTQLLATWRDPTAGPMRFNKTVVAFATTDETLRRTVEDRLAEKVPNSVQSYRLEQSGRSSDSAAIRPNQISGYASTCQAAPIATANPDDPTPAGPSAAVAAALADAQRNLENLRFEVGPPPRNMTKGRTPGT